MYDMPAACFGLTWPCCGGRKQRNTIMADFVTGVRIWSQK